MQKFIKLTYGNSWVGYFNVEQISLVECRDLEGNAVVTVNETANYYVDQKVEEIMEMINNG